MVTSSVDVPGETDTGNTTKTKATSGILFGICDRISSEFCLDSWNKTVVKMNHNVPPPLSVNIEVSDEFKVQEIYPDGTEVYKQPLTMSENFARILDRVDFDKLSTALEESKDGNEIDIPELPCAVSSFVNPIQRPTFTDNANHFEKIKTKILMALQNIQVLHDVLKVYKYSDENYLAIDGFQRNVDATKNPVEDKPIIVLSAKKMALRMAASIIDTAFRRLTSEQPQQMNRNKNDFHSELLLMRQNWRLRKKGSTIIGDLSYRSAGSTYRQGGKFEVVRNETVSPTNPSAVRVIIPKALEGESYFVVRTNKDSDLHSETIFESNPKGAGAHHSTPTTVGEPHWQQRLECAQNILYNEELYSRLAREVVQLKLPIPPIAANKQIIASLFPGLHLSISLFHNSNNSSNSRSSPSAGGSSGPVSVATPEHGNNAVLEHSLHQLLHEVHHRNLHYPLPHPTSATLAVNKGKYFAGPRAFDKRTLASLTPNETILEQVLAQAQHSMLRLRTMCLIDSLAIEVQDPLIIPYWNYLNSPTKTSVKIDMYSYGYEGVSGSRTSVMLHIETRTVKAILRDGRVLNLSFESQELRHLLLMLISQHHILVAQNLSKAMGWRVLAYTPQVGLGTCEPVHGTAQSVVLISPNGQTALAIKSGPHSGLKMKISTTKTRDNAALDTDRLAMDEKLWDDMNGPFRKVDWLRIPGKTFINKLEYLLAFNCTPIKKVQV